MSRTFEMAFNLTGSTSKILKSSMKGFSKDVTDLNKKIADLEQARGSSKRFEDLRKDLLATNREYTEAQKKVNTLAKEMNDAEKPSKKLQQEFERSKRNASGLKDKLSDQKDELRGLKKVLDDAGVSTKNFGKDQKNLEKNLADNVRVQKAIYEGEKNLKKAQENKAQARSDLTGAIAPAMGLIVPTKMAMTAEETMADVNKVADFENEQELKDMERKIMEMNTKGKIPMSFNDLGEIVASGAQAGLDNLELPRFASDAARMGIAFDIDAEAAGDTMANWRSAFRMDQDEVVKLADKVNYLGDTTAATAPDISNLVTRVGTMGEVGGVSAGPIAAIGATLIGMGRGSEESATAVNKMISALNKGSSATDRQAGALKTLGFGATEMAKRMQEDAEGAIIDVLKSIEKLDKHKQSAIINDLFGASGEKAIAPLLLNIEQLQENFDKVDESANKFANSMEEEFQTRVDTSANSMQLLKNNLHNIGITVGNVLLPAVASGTELLSGALTTVQDFTQAHPNLTKGIVMASASMAGMNIATKLGSFAYSSMTEKILKASTNLMKLTSASKAGAIATSGLGTATKTVGIGAKLGAIGFNPWIAGIGLAAGGAYGLYKHLNKDLIPEVELFDDTISDSTKKNVKNYLDLEKKATQSLNNISWTGSEVTKEMADEVTGNFDQMKDHLINNLDEQKEETVSILQETLSETKSLTEEEKARAVEITAQQYEDQRVKVEEGNDRIKEIMEVAKEERRELAEEEREEINEIKEGMKEDAIRILTESEEEQMAIQERLKNEKDELDATEAAEFVQKSIEKMEQTVQAAEDAYDESLKAVARLREEGSEESGNLADKISQDALEQRDEAIAKAEEMHMGVVQHAKEQADEHVKNIDWETGEIMTQWDILVSHLQRNRAVAEVETIHISSTGNTKPKKKGPQIDSIGGYATGGIVDRPELAWVGEGGVAEAIIPLEKNSNSIGLWEQAGKALGMESPIARAFTQGSTTVSHTTGGDTFEFNIDARGAGPGMENNIKESVLDALKEAGIDERRVQIGNG